MFKLKSQLWTNEKGKRFVMVSEKDYLRMSELIEDRGLSRIFSEAIRTDSEEPSIPFAQVKKQLATQRRSAAKKRKA